MSAILSQPQFVNVLIDQQVAMNYSWFKQWIEEIHWQQGLVFIGFQCYQIEMYRPTLLFVNNLENILQNWKVCFLDMIALVTEAGISDTNK